MKISWECLGSGGVLGCFGGCWWVLVGVRDGWGWLGMVGMVGWFGVVGVRS